MSITALTKEELGRLKVSDLRKELEELNLDVTGTKVELVERLWGAIEGRASGETEIKSVRTEAQDVGSAETQAQVSVAPLRGAGATSSEGPPGTSASMLRLKLKLIKSKQEVESDVIRVRAQAQQEELRLRARSEQLDLELQLAEMGEVDESAWEPLRVAAGAMVETPSVESELSPLVRRSLLPPAELRPFTGAVEEFNLFMKAFDSRIAKKTNDKGELLFYLEQYTRGKANQLVKGCLHLGDEGYEEARRLLENRYGNPIRLIDSYVGRVDGWPRIQAGDVEGLDKYSLFLTEVMNAMTGVTMGEFEHPSTLRLVVSKVPVYLQDRWMREADRLCERGDPVRFSDLVSFISAEVRVRRSPLFGPRPPAPSRSDAGAPHPGKFRVNTAKVGEPGGRRCEYCGSAHDIGSCQALRERPWGERRRALMRFQLCFGCLRRGHRVQACRRPLQCDVCRGAHPSVLHRESCPGPLGGPPVTPRGAGVVMPSSGGSGANVVSASLGLRGVSRTALPIVAVRLRATTGKVLVTNALLDQGSSGSFLTERLAARLGVRIERTTVSIETVGTDRKTIPTAMASGLEVSGADGGTFHSLPNLWTVDSLPVTLDDRCSSDELSGAAHLQGVRLCEADSPVELLLGSDCAALIVAREVRAPPMGEEGLCAVRTNVGWYIIGCAQGADVSGGRLSVNFLRVMDACVTEPDAGGGECLYRKLYEHEFGDLSDDREGLSVEDREWIDFVRSNMVRDDGGQFVIPLPKDDFGELPDSLQTASRRLEALRRRFRSDREYFEMYRSVISSLEEDGYAVPVSDGLTDSDHPVWYMPHHGVMEPEKGKLRVVFDCAARSHGVCLNDLLKGGPNLTNSLLGVLCRFREGPVAFTCDIASMYHRVRVPEPDTNLLRFLWFHGSDPEGEVRVWKMTCHVFGAVSSGSVASFALRQCAEEGRSQFPEAADALTRKSYVDDVLCATSSVEGAVKLASDLKELCSTGAFNLTKYRSNSSDVLRQIPVQDRGKSVKELDLGKDSLGSDRLLGLRWSMEDDCFCFQFRDKQKPVTRRGILSTVSSVFDPLGVIAPVTAWPCIAPTTVCPVVPMGRASP
ncbi:uncharacterized protein LOC122375380 [Amphibalanus amphitrite]|uniref:uncharacterized protein LOC122375380 n=1 Tax=Amphibalanus amphitrite TaxID=1232801 RepID=UPI001C91E2B5|nr:uncharacterized protein LOC122375380 [Amphibalanus amphitrite]XP_043210668.1 uncharacterized protein LOC122375380 [Amphibalanus amphitrite]